MKRIIPLPGVEVPGSVAMPTIARTPEGLAMGGIPGWTVLADPAYRTANAVRNRARPRAMMPANATMTAATLSGRPALEVTSTTPRLTSVTPMNPDAWTAFFVVKTSIFGASGGRELIRANDIDNILIGPRIAIRTNGTLAMFENPSANVRLQGPTIPNDETCLLMGTSSIRDGLRLFIDGELVAANPDDTRPLNGGYGAGQYGFHRASSVAMQTGMFGVLDIDLGWPEHAGYRRAIEGFLLDFYGIG